MENLSFKEETEFMRTLAYTEPAKTNRFLISVIGSEIPEYLFYYYELYNEGEKLIIELKMREMLNFFFSTKLFFNITGLKISNLDPTGYIVEETTYDVLKSNFKKTGDYADDGISHVDFIFEVKEVSYVNNFKRIEANQTPENENI